MIILIVLFTLIILTKTIKTRKVQFLKNWNGKVKQRIQNTGKGMINILHKVACKILKKSPDPYTSHTWRQYTATHRTDAGLGFINLKGTGSGCPTLWSKAI